jgi:hypothetical protein
MTDTEDKAFYMERNVAYLYASGTITSIKYNMGKDDGDGSSRKPGFVTMSIRVASTYYSCITNDISLSSDFNEGMIVNFIGTVLHTNRDGKVYHNVSLKMLENTGMMAESNNKVVRSANDFGSLTFAPSPHKSKKQKKNKGKATEAFMMSPPRTPQK